MGGRGKKRSKSRKLLKVEPSELDDGSNVECEGKELSRMTIMLEGLRI